MTEKQRVDLWRKYLPMVRYLARRYSWTQQSYDDLIAEGEHEIGLAVCQWDDGSKLAYDPRKKTEAAWMYWRLRLRMLEWCREAQRQRAAAIDPALLDLQPAGQRSHLLQSLEGDALTVVQIILNAPSELLDGAIGKRKQRKILAYARRVTKWPPQRTALALMDVRRVVCESA